MAKRNSQLTELLIVAQDDYLTIVDTSAGQSKRVSVKNLTGLPDVGWIATGEAWSYSSYNSTLHTGVITVPSDATTKYSKSMLVRFSQTTGGTKYGRITAVTSTTLTVQFPNGVTFNNEALTSPVYSPLSQPYGAPQDADFVYSQSNSGTAGGTIYFSNVGGVKKIWGTTGSLNLSSQSSAAYTIVPPTGFFTTVQHGSVSLASGTSGGTQFLGISGNAAFTTSAMNFFMISSPQSTVTGSSSNASFLMIGT